MEFENGGGGRGRRIEGSSKIFLDNRIEQRFLGGIKRREIVFDRRLAQTTLPAVALDDGFFFLKGRSLVFRRL